MTGINFQAKKRRWTVQYHIQNLFWKGSLLEAEDIQARIKTMPDSANIFPEPEQDYTTQDFLVR